MTQRWFYHGFWVVLIHSIGFQQLGQTWMLLKICFVVVLTIYHLYLGKLLNDFRSDSNKNSLIL